MQWGHETFTEAEMRFAIALVRNAAEQLERDGFTRTEAPTENVLASMLEQVLGPPKLD